MSNHLTPQQLADLAGLSEQDIIRQCITLGVPIHHGRVDRTLFQMAEEREKKQITSSRLN